MSDLRASFVRSPELRIPLRAVASAGSPPIVSRSAWGADESIRKGAPPYAPAIRFASVHHTAGPNSYSPAQAAAIMRAIEVYHVKSNGWNDIGYNFLVDRYGTVYEGRYGGIDRNVIGAYARGFNTGSTGVAVIGTFSTAAIPAAAETSLEKLLAWRLDLAHVDPVSTLTFVSGGSERYRAGVPVVLRAVSGHRDTGLTTCPGDLLYAKLDTIAAKTQAIGLPKLYEPKVTGGLGGPVRFQARVSSALAWKVTVTDALGQQLAVGTGKGPTVDYTWDASLVTAAGANWRIEVAGATPVAGTFGKAGRRRRPAGDHRSRRRPGDDQPERRRPGRFGHDHLLDERPRDGHRDAARRSRRPARDAWDSRQARRRRALVHLRRARTARRDLHDRRHRGRRGGSVRHRAS